MGTYPPLMLCETDRTTFHDGDALAGHLNYWHGPSNPACIRMLTAAEHQAAGPGEIPWDVSGYPGYIS